MSGLDTQVWSWIWGSRDGAVRGILGSHKPVAKLSSYFSGSTSFSSVYLQIITGKNWIMSFAPSWNTASFPQSLEALDTITWVFSLSKAETLSSSDTSRTGRSEHQVMSLQDVQQVKTCDYTVVVTMITIIYHYHNLLLLNLRWRLWRKRRDSGRKEESQRTGRQAGEASGLSVCPHRGTQADVRRPQSPLYASMERIQRQLLFRMKC